MFIYNKLENSIDIYNIDPKEDEIKKYRKRVLHKAKKQEPLFYYLKTNCSDTIETLKNSSNLDFRLLSYENESVLDCGTWSNLYEINESELDRDQEDIIESYIEGHYDKLPIIKVFQYDWEKDNNEELFRLIKPKSHYIASTNSHGNVYEIDDMLNLPRNLYLLHLLKQGKYATIVDERLINLLKMFEINYVKNVKLKDIEEIIEIGLINDSMKNVIKKAETASKVFKKIKQ